jgi:hypothetical protein
MSGGPRPAAFATQPGSGHALEVLRKVPLAIDSARARARSAWHFED